MIVSQIVEI